MLYHRWLPTWLGFERTIELKRQGMALFLNGRALCRGLIPLSGPRGTLQKQSLRPTCLFSSWHFMVSQIQIMSWGSNSCSFVSFPFWSATRSRCCRGQPSAWLIHRLYIHWFSQYLVLSNYEAMFSNSYCDSNCIGPHKPVPAEVRHPVCVTPEDGFRVPGKKKHFLILSNN